MKIFKQLPNINSLKEHEKLQKYRNQYENIIFTNVLRTSLDQYRNIIKENTLEVYDEKFLINIIEDNFRKSRYNLQRVINATGTIIHTNLGRSLYSKNVIDNIINVAKSYNNLEYDISNKSRGSRYTHTVEIIKELTGCEDAVVVNNNAAAILLTLTSLARDGEAVVSRGELIEIGGSFRVPEIMKYSNTTLCEVGTTNRTHQHDYVDAINENTKALVKIHTSNYKIMGFTSEVEVGEIAQIAKEHNVLSIEDIGSGSLVNFSKYTNITEPTIQNSIKAGVDIVTFSGDKLLGGVQAGFIVGKKKYIEQIKKNNLLRSLRVDKLTLAAIEASLQEYLDESQAIKNIPTLRMITENVDDVKKRGEKLISILEKKDNFKLEKSKCIIGGGSLPCVELDSYKVVLDYEYDLNALYERFHQNYIPIIPKIENNKIIIDMKTILDDDYEILKEFLNA
ncbi:MAG: L-seryl-tRNA(Sec) selenium transferase [Bacilli bacterium]